MEKEQLENQIQTHILNHLINDEEYCRRVIPFLKKEYFEGTHKVVFDLIVSFVTTHNKIPSGKVLQLELKKVKVPEDALTQSWALIDEITNKSDIDIEYLIKESEKWCRDRAIYNAIMDSIQIIDGKTDEKRNEGAIPEILSNALGVNFDPNIGHDYIDNSNDRFEFYNTKEGRIPWDLDYFNRITKGGLPNKTLNIIMAGTGVGKSLFMTHAASANLQIGKNVLYITMEMAEERIAERIDANLMNVSMEDLHDLPKTMYDNKIAQIIKSTSGTLIVKEYPTASAHTGHFRGLIKELAIKKSFKPDILFVDYLNICSSNRFKGATNVNSYMYIKAIAEELRGLAVETNIPIMSATQTNRTGYVSSDIGLEDTSESFGLHATADFMFALISNEELDDLNQIAVKQLKNRYNDPTINKRFVLGIDRAKMRLVDVKPSEQTDLVDSNQIEFSEPVFDQTDFGEDWKV